LVAGDTALFGAATARGALVADLPIVTATISLGTSIGAPPHFWEACAGSDWSAITNGDGRSVSLAFGPDSFAKHIALLPDAAIICRPGLANDVDDAQALRNARAVLAGLADYGTGR
jgi:hypothetical protein